jgi:hypothetical protein
MALVLGTEGMKVSKRRRDDEVSPLLTRFHLLESEIPLLRLPQLLSILSSLLSHLQWIICAITNLRAIACNLGNY